MDQNQISAPQPDNKSKQPRGQLAAMLQNRGWESDFASPAQDINRASSAPPLNLMLQQKAGNTFDDQQFALDPRLSRPAYSPGPNNWNLWAPPSSVSATTEAPNPELATGLFAPNPVNAGRSPWSPLRGNETQTSPYRQTLIENERQKFYASAVNYGQTNNNNNVDSQEHTMDELRMRALLHAAIDAKDPVQRAASTPPTRLQLANPRSQSPDLDQAFNQMSMNNDLYDNLPYTVATSTFPQTGYTDTNRSRGGRRLEPEVADYPLRPASAQSGYPKLNMPPPGLSDFSSSTSDSTMNQVLATLIASGNLSMTQIQQIESQLRGSQTQQWPEKGRSSRDSTGKPDLNSAGNSPIRPKDGRRSPGTASDSSPTRRSALLEEFRNNKTKKYELREIVGNIVEFSGDQHGSRFIQQKLESATLEEKTFVFKEILPLCLQLTTDVFGNYVIQKFFEYGSNEQKQQLAAKMEGNVLQLSLQMYGCRVVQKALEYVGPEQRIVLIQELKGNVLKCVKDQNGNHVIQKAIEQVPANEIRFIINDFYGQVYSLATHPYGCRVIQRIFEHCSESETLPLLKELQQHIVHLIQDQYGNYVIQHIVEKGRPMDKEFIIKRVKGNVLTMSKHKFASNVVERCVTYGSIKDKQEIIEEVLTPKLDGTIPLNVMMKDQYANYVVQKLLDIADDEQRKILVRKIRPHLANLKKFTYGKHLITKVEKMMAMHGIE